MIAITYSVLKTLVWKSEKKHLMILFHVLCTWYAQGGEKGNENKEL